MPAPRILPPYWLADMMIAVDTGGTFTDLAAYDKATGRIVFSKALTTYGDFVEGIRASASRCGVNLSDATIFKHGTTLVINTLLERRGSVTALVTTEGFADVLEIGRGNRPEVFNLRYRRDTAVVPRHLRFGVSERMSARGSPITIPDRTEIERLAERLAAEGVEAVAVSFLNAYVNDGHERRVAGWLRDLLQGVFVTAGTELSREWYEFERTATAAANAYVGPPVFDYLTRLERECLDTEQGAAFLMGSSGGLISFARAAQEPIALVESGPVGGCIGAARYAEALGYDNIIAFDMGGTTAKCALVSDGGFEVASTYYVGGYARGFPVKAPVLDIVEVGAGGGSIAWLDAQSRLSVGPRSAGSTPGPACFGRGGVEPTITDANLVLGRLDPATFLSGDLALDGGLAETAIRSRLVEPLGIAGDNALVETADGVLAIASLIMAGAIKSVTVDRGKDPRDFVLFAFGGGGPLHASDLARDLHIPLVVIPPHPGSFSALGMLLADAQADGARTMIRLLDDAALAEAARSVRELLGHAAETLSEREGAAGQQANSWLQMRYVGQTHAVEVPFALTGDDAATVYRRFCEYYLARYGHASDVPAEIVGVRASLRSARPKPPLQAQTTGSAMPEQPPRRAAWFGRKQHDTPVYDRADLPMGCSGTGPALIEEFGSTICVNPGDSFSVGTLGEIVIQIGGGGGAA